MARIGIVSAFGRGEYLAEKLQSQGLDVTLIDLSHLFVWPKKMWEGPFPLIQSTRISQEMWTWIENNYSLRESKSGFTVLSSQGVFEFRGSVIEQRVRFLEMDPRILHTPAQGFDSTFDRSWPLRLLTYGTRNLEIPPSRNIGTTQIKTRQESLVQKIFRQMERQVRSDQGAKVSRQIDRPVNCHVEDVAFISRGLIDGILIKKERSELLKVDHLVWALTSAETQYLNPVLNQKLFHGEVRESIYSWLSYEVKMAGVDYFPHHFIWMEDPELPWSHSNFVCFHHLEKDHFQVWLKIPTAQRFLSTALAAEEEHWIQAFQKRIPGLRIEVLESPLECGHSSKTLGPSIFGTYKEGVLQKAIELDASNIHFLNPEQAQSIAPHFLLELEESIEPQISKWWIHEQEQIAKKKMRESRP